MINNFDKVIDWFNVKGIYHISIIKRKKENPSLSKNSIKIAEYYFSDKESLLSSKNDIISIAEATNSRIYITLINRSVYDILCNLIMLIIPYISTNVFPNLNGLINKSFSKSKKLDKRFVVDFDDCKEDIIHEFIKDFKLKDFLILPTVNGYHLICERFDVMKFKKKYKYEVLKDCTTLLYYNSSNKL